MSGQTIQNTLISTYQTTWEIAVFGNVRLRFIISFHFSSDSRQILLAEYTGERYRRRTLVFRERTRLDSLTRYFMSDDRTRVQIKNAQDEAYSKHVGLPP